MLRFVSVLFFVLVFAPITIFAQTGNAAGAPGCGDPSAKFKVKTANGQHAAQPDAGKAVVYFIEDDSNFGSFPKPTTRAGVDGKWVGAMHGNSYLYSVVDPGVHHLCASWQRAVIMGRGLQTAGAHFTAGPGGVYYFEVKNRFINGESSQLNEMTLTQLDSDEGQLLVNKFALATSELKN